MDESFLFFFSFILFFFGGNAVCIWLCGKFPKRRNVNVRRKMLLPYLMGDKLLQRIFLNQLIILIKALRNLLCNIIHGKPKPRILPVNVFIAVFKQPCIYKFAYKCSIQIGNFQVLYFSLHLMP